MRTVIKIGTSTLTHTTGNMNIRRVEKLCKTVSDLKNAGHEIVLVSSGAIAMGMGKLKLASRPTDMPTKQAAAAVGQCELMDSYDRLFGQYNHTAAQLLITGADLKSEERRKNFHNTVFRLLELSALPIINENDTVATDEISVGDNDTLAAIVACSLSADLLILLSDIDGLYTADPHTHPDATVIPRVEEITPDIISIAGGSNGSLGTGGMATKLHAASITTAAGIPMVIANGEHPEYLYDIFDGKSVGTYFVGRKEKADDNR